MSLRPDSPCQGVCTTLYTDVCRGCGRHYLEVSQWVTMTDEQKDVVWHRLQREGWVDANWNPTSKTN